jgi:autotransporter-associated beta strand protein
VPYTVRNYKNERRIALAATAVVGFAHISRAADATWASNPAGSFWNAANWVNGGSYTPVANDALCFDASSVTAISNNFAAFTNFDGITFADTADSFVVGGNAITLGGDIAQNAEKLQTLNIGLRLSADRGITVATFGTLVLGGIESSATAGINKSGSGMLVLGAANTYTGTTTVNQGQVRMNGSYTGGGTWNVTAATLSGTGTINARVNLLSGVILPGDPEISPVSVLTVASLSLSGSSGLHLDINASGLDRVNVVQNGGLSLNGLNGVNVTNLGGIAAGQYTLLDYTGTALANLSNFVLATPSVAGFDLSLVNNTADTSVDLLVSVPTIVASFWNVDADGDWSNNANWRSPGQPNGVGHVAHFTTFPVTITAPRTVTVDAPKRVGQMVFAGSEPYTIAGANAITMDANSGNAVIEVQSGNHTISAPVSLDDDLSFQVVSQSGLTLFGILTSPGRTITKEGLGSVNLERVRAASLVVSQGIVQISPKATPNDPAGTSVVQSLSISPGAKLYMNNNSMIIDYTGSVGSLVTNIRQHLQNFRLIGNAAIGSFSGNLGYADNAALDSVKTTFAGQSVDPSSILIKFTYGGDADLDGDVDVADLGKLATSWQAAAVWSRGDFDFDGIVNVNDLGILASNWQAGVGSPLGPSFAEAAAALGLPTTAVPEPATMGFLGALATWALMRPDRRFRSVQTNA